LNFEKYFFLVSENSYTSNSTCFIATLLPYYLKNNFKVIFIGCNEGLIHYNNISKRYGTNLLNHASLYYIDLFFSPYKTLIKEELPLGEIYPPTFNSVKSKNYYLVNNFYKENRSKEGDNISEEVDTTKLLDIISNLVKENNLNKEKTILIIDNISSLPVLRLKEFINEIYLQCIDFDINFLLGLNKLLHCSSSTSSISEEYVYLSHMADVEFEFCENDSGFSKDIDGNVNISIKSSYIENSWKLIYKIKENCIEFFTNLVV
jgi:hypothetical protein